MLAYRQFVASSYELDGGSYNLHHVWGAIHAIRIIEAMETEEKCFDVKMNSWCACINK